jgi:ABC-type transport system involved in multi-copper enzyme maturation permease subunit
MKVGTLALSTLESFLHNRIVVLVLILGFCIVGLMMIPLWGAKVATTASNHQAMEGMVLEVVSRVMSFMSGLGSVLAAWGAADAVYAELKSGTVLAVMARPVKRWEFLLGKYLGVLLFMFCYVLLMLAMSYFLVFFAGMRVHAAPWILLVYPMVRYAIWAGLALIFTTFVHPAVTMGILLALYLLMEVSGPDAFEWTPKLQWLKTGLFYLLPSTNLLTEGRFLSLRQASIKQAGWVQHAISLGYALDIALILVLLAMWSFHYRSLRQD